MAGEAEAVHKGGVGRCDAEGVQQDDPVTMTFGLPSTAPCPRRAKEAPAVEPDALALQQPQLAVQLPLASLRSSSRLLSITRSKRTA